MADPRDYECGPGRPCPERAHDHWPGPMPAAGEVCGNTMTEPCVHPLGTDACPAHDDGDEKRCGTCYVPPGHGLAAALNPRRTA